MFLIRGFLRVFYYENNVYFEPLRVFWGFLRLTTLKTLFFLKTPKNPLKNPKFFTVYLMYTACPILVFGKTPHAHASQNPRHRTCLTPPPGHRTRMLESQKQICRIPICASPHNITQIKTKQNSFLYLHTLLPPTIPTQHTNLNSAAKTTISDATNV